jgi:hypothetical protein
MRMRIETDVGKSPKSDLIISFTTSATGHTVGVTGIVPA